MPRLLVDHPAAPGQPASANLDPAWLRLFRLRQHQRNHAILHLRCDLLLINLTGEAETPPVRTDVVFAVNGPKALILAEIDAAFDREHALFDVDVHIVP